MLDNLPNILDAVGPNGSQTPDLKIDVCLWRIEGLVFVWFCSRVMQYECSHIVLVYTKVILN